MLTNKKYRYMASALSVLALLLTIILMPSCSSSVQADETKSSGVPVRVQQAVNKDYVQTIVGSGVVEADHTINLSFKTGGVIAKLKVKEGDTVVKGQILGQLDLAEISSSAQMAAAGLAKAERDLKRVQALYNDGVATIEQLQDATTNLEVMRSKNDIAIFNLQHSTIRAPSNGRILRRLAEVGELTSPGRPIFIFGATGRAFFVRVAVTDRDIVALSLGDKAEVFLDAYPLQQFFATISELAAAADPVSGTFAVELEMQASDVTLLQGMIARVSIKTKTVQHLPFIPFEALTEGNGKQAYVFIVDKKTDKVHRTQIEIAAIVGNEVVISQGLSAGSLVVTEGSAYLRDQENIKIVAKKVGEDT
ncbi:MAG: efflux RND transporter periplasmic adaptor subunit [Deltaproteobacteria bacterium]|nr:efflux RND transporter periplasmic adaptor subunit [Deltaproteobacteria bacterium]